MKNVAWSVALVLIVGLPASLAPAEPGPAAVGEPAPAFALDDEQGKSHALGDYAGKVLVLEWTNQDCPYVQRHYRADTMERLAAEFGERDVVWLAVNSTRSNTPAKTLRWRDEQGLEYATLQDAEGKVGKRYGARTTPHMFVIDPAGALRYSGAIDDDPRGTSDVPENYVRGALGAVLAGKAPEPTSTAPYGCSVKYE